MVGDGSISAGWLYTPPISVVGGHRSMRESNERPPRKPFANPLLMFAYPDVLVLLIFTGAYYAVMYGVTASLSVIFEKVYPYLTQTDLGLCFLGIGGGMLFGTWVSGRLSDAYYRKIRDDIIHQAQSHSEKDVDTKAIEQDPSFPIEKARLQLLPCVLFVYTACVMGYGWSLESKVSIAVPLICQIISKFALCALHCPAWRLTAFCSWPNVYNHIKRYPDPVGRSVPQPRILHHGMCTSTFRFGDDA
jgi:hypothetical protein